MLRVPCPIRILPSQCRLTQFHNPAPPFKAISRALHFSGKQCPQKIPIKRVRGCLSVSNSSAPDDDFDVELGRLLALLPEEMRIRAGEHPELRDLVEVVMDLGRKPLARFPSSDFVLSDSLITLDDLERATSQVTLDYSIIALPSKFSVEIDSACVLMFYLGVCVFMFRRGLS
uniref:Uncharacterized protein MANES_15G091200 n=1 Tax=Rhizophora mucronata TaxID=61149 RepID=A0A2P2L3P2_RHIMU